MRYEILDEQGNVVNTILAMEDFVQQRWPGRWRKVVEQLRKESRIATEDFFERFTDAELEAILAASRTNAKVALFLKRLDLQRTIDLAAPRIVAAVNALETATLIAAGRAAVILAY